MRRTVAPRVFHDDREPVMMSLLAGQAWRGKGVLERVAWAADRCWVLSTHDVPLPLARSVRAGEKLPSPTQE